MERDTRDTETYRIIGAAMAVHRFLGAGFLESVYQEALEIELGTSSIPYAREVKIPVHYKGRALQSHFKADFICYNSIIVEIKAQKTLSGSEESQLINYLKASGLIRGLLLNFGTPSLYHKRYILT